MICLDGKPKETQTINIIKKTLAAQLRVHNGSSEDIEAPGSLEDMQKLMIDYVVVNVQIKEREEMKKMSDSIWNLRNRYKAEVLQKFDSLQNTPRTGAEKLNQLLA